MEEMQEFEAYRAEKASKELAQRIKAERDAYKELVNESIEAAFPGLESISNAMKDCKAGVYETFQKALDMKQELFNTKSDQQSHTFINNEHTKRIVLGKYMSDGYDDTVNEGIAKVKDYISSLAKDKESKILVDAILKLLSRDKEGNLKASRIIQLRKMAEETGDATFMDGVRIIEDSYIPTDSKCYVRAQKKNDKGAWVDIPLGMTEA